VDRKHNLPVKRLELRAQDGRALGPDDTTIQKIADLSGSDMERVPPSDVPIGRTRSS
jgi:hypothetical protein